MTMLCVISVAPVTSQSGSPPVTSAPISAAGASGRSRWPGGGAWKGSSGVSWQCGTWAARPLSSGVSSLGQRGGSHDRGPEVSSSPSGPVELPTAPLLSSSVCDRPLPLTGPSTAEPRADSASLCSPDPVVSAWVFYLS